MMKKIFYLSLALPFLISLFNFIFFLFEIPKKSYILPIFSFLVVLINGFFFLFVFKKDRRLAYFFQGTAFLVQILILIYLILS